MPENIEPLLYWVHERESIRIKRLDPRVMPPYTDDPILAKYRFCNVRRSDDRVSAWLIANVLTPANMKKAGLGNFLMFSAWARTVNWPPTIKAVMDAKLFPRKVMDWKKIGQLTDQLAKKGKAWTGAFMVRAPKKKGAKKGKFVAEVVIGRNFKVVVPELLRLFKSANPTYRAAWELLQTVDGIASFMAGQIAGDWTYTPLLSGATDLKTFAPMGPGSVRGFNRIMGIKPITKKPSEELWLAKLQEWRGAVVERLGGGVYEDMDLLSVQNQNCELDKYLRTKNGEGRPRAQYRPETAY